VVNLAWLPLLTVVHERHVVKRATQQRLAMQRGDQTVLIVAWLLPCGRAVLRFASSVTLAGILTVRGPPPAHGSPPHRYQPIATDLSLPTYRYRLIVRPSPALLAYQL
jgi:hypothetical protein